MFKAPPICPRLPVRLGPLGEFDEKELIVAILESVGVHYGLMLVKSPSLEHGMATLVGRKQWKNHCGGCIPHVQNGRVPAN
jgi:hypothetical protein